MSKTGLSSGVRLTVLGIAILVIGLACAVSLYDAPASDSTTNRYEVLVPALYPVQSADTKQYEEDLEVVGGRTAVIADEFSRKLRNACTGKHLAYLLGGITIVLAAVTFSAAWRIR